METAEGRIIDPKYTWIYTTDLNERIEKKIRTPENRELIKRFVRDASLGKTIKEKAKKKVGKPRQVKYLQDLKKLDQFFRKPLDTVTSDDMERFIKALEDGDLTLKNGKPYAKETQVGIKKIVIKFYKWINDGQPNPITNWIDTSYTIKEYRALTQDQVREMADSLLSNSTLLLHRNRAIIHFLFDSGCRIDEALNIRLRNLEEKNGTYYARVEHSKTTPRTISLPLCSKHLRTWLDAHPDKDNPEATLFHTTYKSVYDMLRRAGKRVLNQSVTPHVLRKASATYWARQLSRYPLCKRFGWKMSSRQPDRYIDVAGIEEEQVAQAVEKNHVAQLEEKNADMARRLALMEDQMRTLLGPEIAEVKKILARVRNS